MQNIFDLLQRRIWLGPLILLLALGVGLGVGLLVGWVVLPVGWTPSADDAQAIADSYALNNDLALARQRLQSLSPTDQARLLARVVANATARNRPIEAERATALAQALRVPIDGASVPASSAAPPTFPLTTILFGVGALVALAVVAGGGFLFVTRVLPRLRAARPTSIAEDEATEMVEPAEIEERGVSVAESANSLGRYQASYAAGMDNFDASFPLETARQGFLGECGIGVSETVGDGLPDKVTAFDLWLFDKTDVRTVTQILMSDYAFNDTNVRNKLATKGDAVHASKDETLTLETQSLRIEARITELVYASNPALSPNSYFQKFVVEIASYLK